MVAKTMSVPTAVGAETPITAIRNGVIREPPPTPVRPTRKPTRSPKRVGEGSISGPVELSDGPQVAELLEPEDNPARALVRLLLVGLDVELGGGRRLVGVGDAGELRDLTGEGLFVEALDVALGAGLYGRVHEDLDKVLPYRAPHLVARLLERRDGRDYHPDPVAREQLGDEADAQDVYVPIFLAEGETLAEVGAHDIPVEDLYLAKPLPQLSLDDLGYGG